MIDVRPLDQFDFDECDWQAINQDLDRAVNHRLGLGYRLHEKLKNSYGRKRELIGSFDCRVEIDDRGSDEFSIVEVHAADRPGQLYRITQTMADFGINIHKAFIATEVDQLIDVFYVTDKKGNKLEDGEYRKEIINGLMHAIGELDESTAG